MTARPLTPGASCSWGLPSAASDFLQMAYTLAKEAAEGGPEQDDDEPAAPTLNGRAIAQG